MKSSEQFFKDLNGIDTFIEATRFEQVALWKEHQFKPEGYGYARKLGDFGDAPVWISLSCVDHEGLRLCFWEATSQVVDYRLADDFFKKYLDNGAHKTDPTNFHNIRKKK